MYLNRMSDTTVLLIVQIDIYLGLLVSTLVKSSSGPVRYRSRNKAVLCIVGSPQRLHTSSVQYKKRGMYNMFLWLTTLAVYTVDKIIIKSKYKTYFYYILVFMC